MRYYVVVLNILVRKASPSGPLCFRGLILSLLFLLCFIASWTQVVVSEMYVLCVACLTVFVKWLVQ